MARDPHWCDRISAVARCDGNLIVRYQCTEEPLPCPVHAFVGDVDSYGSFHDVDGWERYTTSAFTVHTVPGGHLFYTSRPEELMSELTRLLDGYVRRLEVDVPNIGPNDD
jgi:surfactin synthase thioesterase subunit